MSSYYRNASGTLKQRLPPRHAARGTTETTLGQANRPDMMQRNRPRGFPGHSIFDPANHHATHGHHGNLPVRQRPGCSNIFLRKSPGAPLCPAGSLSTRLLPVRFANAAALPAGSQQCSKLGRAATWQPGTGACRLSHRTRRINPLAAIPGTKRYPDRTTRPMATRRQFTLLP